MAVSDTKTRVMLTLDNDLLARVDAHCERYGITRSGFFASLAADKFSNADAMTAAAERVMGKWMDDYTERMEKNATDDYMKTPEFAGLVSQIIDKLSGTE